MHYRLIDFTKVCCTKNNKYHFMSYLSVSPFLRRETPTFTFLYILDVVWTKTKNKNNYYIIISDYINKSEKNFVIDFLTFILLSFD